MEKNKLNLEKFHNFYNEYYKVDMSNGENAYMFNPTTQELFDLLPISITTCGKKYTLIIEKKRQKSISVSYKHNNEKLCSVKGFELWACLLDMVVFINEQKLFFTIETIEK